MTSFLNFLKMIILLCLISCFSFMSKFSPIFGNWAEKIISNLVFLGLLSVLHKSESFQGVDVISFELCIWLNSSNTNKSEQLTLLFISSKALYFCWHMRQRRYIASNYDKLGWLLLGGCINIWMDGMEIGRSTLIFFCFLSWRYLTHSFPMHPFSTSWKHVLRGWRKGGLGKSRLSYSGYLFS